MEMIDFNCASISCDYTAGGIGVNVDLTENDEFSLLDSIGVEKVVEHFEVKELCGNMKCEDILGYLLDTVGDDWIIAKVRSCM